MGTRQYRNNRMITAVIAVLSCPHYRANLRLRVSGFKGRENTTGMDSIVNSNIAVISGE